MWILGWLVVACCVRWCTSNALTDTQIKTLASLNHPEHFNPRSSVPESLLSPILIPRVSGTAGNVQVRQFLVDFMKQHDWHVELDEFVADTPYGKKNMANVIATLNPDVEQRIVLTAHFDSKYFPPPDEDQFLAATDSAVPCAMLLDLVKSLNTFWHKDMQETVQIVFFDGEEAFVEWSHTDSIYGARHLAQVWDQQNKLTSISLFVLLDLIGAANPTFVDLQRPTTEEFAKLRHYAIRLQKLNLLASSIKTQVDAMHMPRVFSTPGTGFGYKIEDDHLPFLKKRVPILHLIPVPFPDVWHRLDDNGDAVDVDTVVDLTLILRLFVVDRLRLLDPRPSPPPQPPPPTSPTITQPMSDIPVQTMDADHAANDITFKASPSSMSPAHSDEL